MARVFENDDYKIFYCRPYISYRSHCCIKQTKIALLVFPKRLIVAHVSSIYCAKVRNKSKFLMEIHSFYHQFHLNQVETILIGTSL